MGLDGTAKVWYSIYWKNRQRQVKTCLFAFALSWFFHNPFSFLRRDGANNLLSRWFFKRMKIINHTLPADGPDHIKIIPLTDLHLGDAQANLKIIHSLVTEIETEPNTYCILGGDLINNAILGSCSSIYADATSHLPTPMEQLNACVDLLGPIAEQGKILGCVPGNHEFRTTKQTGIDLTALLSAQLGIDDVYSDASLLLYIKTGRKNDRHHPKQQITYAIFCSHGTGGGRKPGSKLNKLTDMASVVPGCDIYVCGHTHMPMIARQRVMVPDRRHGTVAVIDQLFVNSASALNYGGYGERLLLPASSQRYPRIILHNHHKSAEAVL